MQTEQELKNVIQVYRENLELETKMEELRKQIEHNHRRLVEHFFPYLLSIYAKWRPRIGEKAMHIDLAAHYCFEVTIKTIDGYVVRAQEGEKTNVHHRFELNPVLDEEFRFPCFILPQSSYDEIKDFFDLTLLK